MDTYTQAILLLTLPPLETPKPLPTPKPFKPPKRLFAGQQRCSRRSFDRFVTKTRQRYFTVVDPRTGKSWIVRKNERPTLAQATAAAVRVVRETMGLAPAM